GTSHFYNTQGGSTWDSDSQEDLMDHLLNWIEIPVTDMKRAVSFYRELLNTDLHEMKIGTNDYALFAVKDKFNSCCLVKGDGYVPRTDGVVVYLNGGQDLSPVLGRVEKSGGSVLLKKTFSLRKQVILPTSKTPRATKLACTV